MPSAKLLFIAFVTALLSGAESFSLSPRTGAPSPTTLRASNPQMIQSWYDSGIRLKALQYDDEERLGGMHAASQVALLASSRADRP